MDEAAFVFEKGGRLTIIGTGQYLNVNLFDEADNFFKEKKRRIKLQPTLKAIETSNTMKEQKTIGLFHVIC